MIDNIKGDEKMDIPVSQDAISFLNSIVGHSVLYAHKSPDTELYDFGFGNFVEIVDWKGRRRQVASLTVHALCRFRVISRKEHRVSNFYEDTPTQKFDSKIQPLIGQKVKRIALSEKNDFWLDFGDYWMVFVTHENGKESWRFFATAEDTPHFVAADSWIDFS